LSPLTDFIKFNSPRGDGFPLAAFLAMVSSEIPEFNPIFEAHVYNVCPTVIPHIPKIEETATEDELMESLGMIRDKTGNFESFDRFLTRTEGIISIVANIVSSLPDHHTLFGGCSKAILWLHRFLSLLPPSPIQLPLNTAPVLDSFLTGAGHMLANLYADEFKPILYQITTDIAPRLDEGSIGAPSAHRLKETLKNGFEGFLHTLPTRALKDFYNNGILTAPGQSHIQVTEKSENPFSASNAQSFMTDSFNNVEQSMALGQTPHFGVRKSNQTDFTTAQSIPSAYPNQGSTNSPFGALNTSLPTSFGVSNTTTSNPFGAPSTVSSTPFGASNSASSTPFGVPRNTQSTPFGTSITGSSTFGVPNTVLPFGASNTSSSTPFGNPSHGISSTSSLPFGVASAGIPSSTDATKSIAAFGASSASPFGNSSNSAQSGFASGTGTSFGDIPKNSANAKGFEGNQTYQQQPFGGIIGNVTSGKKPIPCKFFAQGSCRNGNNCRFSHDIQPNNEMESTSRSGQTVNNGLGNNNPFGGPRR
jgi:GLE1-like protein/CCCH-type zinc finger